MAGTLDRQEQLRRNLVADVAHELRTPIAVLQAGHEALLDGVAEPTPAELASLRDEVLRLARMVGDLQTLAAADAAALHLALRPLRPGRARRRRGRQPGPPVRGGRHHPGPAAVRGPGARRSALAAPGHHQPAQQRAEVHPARRPGHHQHQAGRRRTRCCRSPTPAPASPPTSCRISSTGSGAAGRRADLRQRHRPGGRRRAGPGARRPADRHQPARPRHGDDARHPLRLTAPAPALAVLIWISVHPVSITAARWIHPSWRQ